MMAASSLQSLPETRPRQPASRSSSQAINQYRFRTPSTLRNSVAAAVLTLGAVAIGAAPAKTATPMSIAFDHRYPDVDRNADLSAQVISYGFLETDWDGAGGVTPSSESIALALSFIDLLPLGANPTGSMVEGTGEIGFYWKKPGTYVDITFDRNTVSYYAKVPNPASTQPMVVKGRSTFNGSSLPEDLLAAISLA